MGLEILLSTMNRNDMSFLDNMNISSDITVVNQADHISIQETIINNNKLTIITNTERGLSNSRNGLLELATQNICIIADDDVEYINGYQEIILNAHKDYPDIDIIVFKMLQPENSNRKKKYPSKNKRIGFLRSMRITSPEITFKRERIIESGVNFNNLFGAGAYYGSGEENIFLKDCLKKGLKILFIPKTILQLKESESTWFSGYNEEYLYNRGAIFFELFNKVAFLAILQFAIRKRSLFGNISIFKIISLMYKGVKDYKNRKMYP